jgi:hypothetical protein
VIGVSISGTCADHTRLVALRLEEEPRVPYKPPSTLITFRTSPASAAKLQDLANKIGASRSMLTVLLLQAALNDGQIISKIKDLYGSRS